VLTEKDHCYCVVLNAHDEAAFCILSCIPLLVLSGALMSLVASSRGQAAYPKASSVVEQTIGSIRTVASFTGERLAITKYNQSLIKAYINGVQELLVWVLVCYTSSLSAGMLWAFGLARK
ncbi:hypothetical protein V8G54_018708, partial [Vigna mungo]